ncbi:MAG: efflux RND transporter periplasmic adaptor subunit [Verrucomicrobia bacterium]|nr:efflux RND transporter periplasmic adaptor subunit [Verrucomicrobiota bacterium]
MFCLAAASLVGFAGCDRSYSSPQPKSTGERGPAKRVRVVEVKASPQERLVYAIGSLAACDQAALSTKVAGRLQKIPVDLGSVVRKGDLIAQIEPRDYQLRVQQTEALLAQARVRLGLPLAGTNDTIDAEQTGTFRQTKAVLEEARANRDRVNRLSAEGIVSKSDLDTAAAAYEVALSRHQDAAEEIRNRQALVAQRRAELEIAQQQLIDSAIHAPFDGVVQERRANAGEYLVASAPLVTLVRMDPLRLRLEVRERDAPQVRIGQKVRLTLEGATNVYHGEITRLSPTIDEETRMLRVEADVPNPGSLRPGSFARGQIIVDDKSPGIVIPASAVATFAGVEKVYAVQSGKAVEKQIITGERRGQLIELVTGLKPGDLIVLEPGNLIAGETVAVEND